ncbi:MAG TPA: hydroxymethylglutaryl-CoA lyase [Oscillospiraceae bacterium]|nr:hydroxymethylglutaryl-CoA lyase [Oscillospiraceae bacterium]
MSKKVQIVEVGPRDGFQSVKEFIPTETKKKVIDMLVASGCRKIQATSFVNPKVIPQMADAAEVSEYVLKTYPNVSFYALTPNARGVENACDAGFREVSYVISVSPGHNMANVRRTIDESFEGLAAIRQSLPDMKIVLDAATTFGCPFDGKVSIGQVVAYLEKARAIGITIVDLCDTIGIANPRQVRAVLETVCEKFPEIDFGVHIHDTRNMGMANSLAAIECGVTRVSTTVGGMGGCPFAPGASGNTSTEDLVFMLQEMGYDTGIDFAKLLETARFLKENVPANYSGHQMNIAPSQCVMG